MGISLILSGIIIGNSILLANNVGPKFHSIPISLIINVVIIIILSIGIILTEKKL